MAVPPLPRPSGTVVGLAALAGVGGLAAWSVAACSGRYRRDLAAAEARLATVEREVVDTPLGAVEYADEGSGPPVLVSHGIFHGADGGLTSTRDLLVGRRIIVPSRFGYLGSALPPDATGADQADAFAALLDRLDLERVDVLAISAGTGAAIHLALRHPDRVAHLVISSGNHPGSPTAAAPPGWARLVYSDRVMWTMRTLARPMFGRLMGVPPGFPRDADDEAAIERLLDSIFPIGPRVAGAVFDAWVSNPEIDRLPLEAITAPTLVVHTRDDPLASYPAAVDATARIPGASLLTLDSGGHLQLGCAERVRAELDAFLGSGTAVSSRG